MDDSVFHIQWFVVCSALVFILLAEDGIPEWAKDLHDYAEKIPQKVVNKEAKYEWFESVFTTKSSADNILHVGF